MKNVLILGGGPAGCAAAHQLKINGGYDVLIVKKDFENTIDLVSEKGLLCFHDIKAPSAPDVGKFYNKLKKKNKYFFKEFYCDWTPMKTGIGVLGKK